jgi:dephospho-CoA kinase
MRCFYRSFHLISAAYSTYRTASYLFQKQPLVVQTRTTALFSSTKIYMETSIEPTMLYSAPIQVALTGSIGMGKSTVTKQLRKLGFAVFDADEAVHQLYSPGGEAVAPIQASFPSAIVDNAVDRKALMNLIMMDNTVIKQIERIVHPLVIAKRQAFLEAAKNRGAFLVVYDIPLFFENRKQYDVDYVMVVSADAETQRQRVLKRPGMTEEKFMSILAKQVPDEEKRKGADFVILTNYSGFSEGRAQLAAALNAIIAREPAKWQAWQQFQNHRDTYAMRRGFDAILFDLDDTLVPTNPPIRAALAKLAEFGLQYMPKTQEVLTARMSEVMSRAWKDFPLIEHDITELRRRALQSLAVEFGEEEYVGQAIELLVRERSNVGPYLYEDVTPFLEYAKERGLRLGVLTNGNANISYDNSLSRYNMLCLGAADVGCSKPSPLGFLACVQLLDVAPHRVLFVGDDYDKDCAGAKAAGMKTMLLSRDKAVREEDKANFPDADLCCSRLSIEEYEAFVSLLSEDMLF